MAEVKVEDVMSTCAVELTDGLHNIYRTRCNAPGVALCEKHLDAERQKAQRGYEELRAAYDQVRLVLGNLVRQVETEATTKMRLCAAVDAAKTVLR